MSPERDRRRRVGALGRACAGAVAVLALAGCRQDMHDQPKYEPLEASRFFADGMASRPALPGTVARGQLNEDSRLHQGREADGSYVTEIPVLVDHDLLSRGQTRYDIFCSPCHDRVGRGRGMVVRRGYPPPPSLHEERLRSVEVGYLFDVVTEGYGVMPSYARQTSVYDRWAISAYVRALQMSQDSSISELPASDRVAVGRTRSGGDR